MIPMCGIIKGPVPLGPSLSPLSAHPTPRSGLDAFIILYFPLSTGPHRNSKFHPSAAARCLSTPTGRPPKDYEVAAVLREPGRPNVAYMVTPDKERRYVGGAFITLNEKMRERLWARVNASAKPLRA